MKDHYSQTDLKARGWSAGLIKSLLGDPCATKANPAYRSAPPMKLWRTGKVEQAEQDERFLAHQEKRVAMSKRAKDVAERKRQELLAEIDAMAVTVKEMPMDRLIKAGVRSWETRERWDEYRDGSGADEDTKLRWAVNYVRHQLTDYDHHLEEVAGRIGVHDAVIAIQRKVYAAIIDTYPELKNECIRQMERRGISYTPPEDEQSRRQISLDFAP